MTDEEKAMTSFKKNVCEVCEIKDVCDVSILDCRAYNLDYEDAYLDGLTEGRKLGKEEQWKAMEKAQKKTSARIRELEKANAELKEYVSRTGYRIAELKHEIDELIEKLKGFENGDVAWQGDMDATIKQNLELKEQNKAILEDNDTLNKWVDELKSQIEDMKTCSRCGIRNRDLLEEPCKSCLKDGIRTKWI